GRFTAGAGALRGFLDVRTRTRGLVVADAQGGTREVEHGIEPELVEDADRTDVSRLLQRAPQLDVPEVLVPVVVGLPELAVENVVDRRRVLDDRDRPDPARSERGRVH